MTKYLSFNANGYIQLPSLTFNRIVYDMSWEDNGTASEFITRGHTYRNDVLIYDGTYRSGLGTPVSVTVDGSAITNSNQIPYSKRITLDYTVATYTDAVTIFSSDDKTSPAVGNIYDIKIYNSATLIAHYDMSTGTVNDQSGNENNATLNGGTWLDDGAGATGTPVTYTYDTKQIQYANIQNNYDTKQSIYANVNLNADTKQNIYANRVTQFDTKQSIYKPINQSYDTKQAIYKAIQELFDTEQVFTQAYTQVSYTYDMKIQQYKDIQESLDTKQSYYTDISVDLDTKQVIYKQIQSLYDTLIQIRNTHDETLYGTLTIQRVIEHRLTINKRHSEDLKIERVLNHILRV